MCEDSVERRAAFFFFSFLNNRSDGGDGRRPDMRVRLRVGDTDFSLALFIFFFFLSFLARRMNSVQSPPYGRLSSAIDCVCVFARRAVGRKKKKDENREGGGRRRRLIVFQLVVEVFVAQENRSDGGGCGLVGGGDDLPLFPPMCLSTHAYTHAKGCSYGAHASGNVGWLRGRNPRLLLLLPKLRLNKGQTRRVDNRSGGRPPAAKVPHTTHTHRNKRERERTLN